MGSENYDTSVNISGNYFHEVYYNKSAKLGKCPHTNEVLTLGANYWKEIPTVIDDSIFNNITFTQSEQKRF